jgi:hypothetical protein
MTAKRAWKGSFDDPIPVPRGRQLVTLEDAGNYTRKLPKAEHEAPEWQAASADPGSDVRRTDVFARIVIMRALNRRVERVFNPARKDHHWGMRKLKGDE